MSALNIEAAVEALVAAQLGNTYYTASPTKLAAARAVAAEDVAVVAGPLAAAALHRLADGVALHGARIGELEIREAATDYEPASARMSP